MPRRVEQGGRVEQAEKGTDTEGDEEKTGRMRGQAWGGHYLWVGRKAGEKQRIDSSQSSHKHFGDLGKKIWVIRR